ncbi:MAG: putative toxin-antitoxin system toxin component, PIN family [Planctomycetia bacterium]|nr:putative toxin-antitoxin system toxin component, PIN family [Planctomycetia bacterium]
MKVADPSTTPDFPRDPKDAPILAAALATGAEFLITGDRDLLDARGAIATRIVTVAEFAAECRIS